ncbi:MAG TPA: hypothetical protein PKG48_09800, partial [Bacteroidales bacterium]|nr:hypothetical protein [Bacteroidales bacterium]
METETSKTIFIEYESYGKDRHFMTVLQTLGFRKVVVGRIFKEYDHTSKTSTYRAVDFNGDEIFGTTDHLLDL